MDINIEMECIGVLQHALEEGEHVVTLRPVMGQSQNLVGAFSPQGEVQFKTRVAEHLEGFKLRGRYVLTISNAQLSN